MIDAHEHQLIEEVAVAIESVSVWHMRFSGEWTVGVDPRGPHRFGSALEAEAFARLERARQALKVAELI